MLARRPLPPEYLAWNTANGAPFGRDPWRARVFRRLLPDPLRLRLAGPFSVQSNSTTREFEYPWAFAAGSLTPGDRVVEIGGGLSGFQFALDRAGQRVTNVDPATDADRTGWACDPSTHEDLNRVFGTRVELRNTTAREAGLAPGGYDRAFCLSVIEHVEEEERRSIVASVYDALRPGGLFVLTIDLFLNLAPFEDAERNRYGTNVDVRSVVEGAPFEILVGDKTELHGFPEFDAPAVRRSLSELVVGTYPALVQCLVLRRP